MLNFFKQIFTGVTGEFSSKRTVTFFAVVMMLIAFVAQVFFGVEIPQWMFESVVYVVIAGVGFVATEHLGTFKSGT